MASEADKPRSLFPGGPIAWETSVSPAGRLRIPVQIVDEIVWLKDMPRGEPCDCIARIGRQKQLILAKSIPTGVENSVGKFINRQEPIDEEDGLEIAMDLLQYAASMWPVRLSSEHKTRRRELTLPRGARLIKVAPSSREPAVVLAFRSRLEVWRHDLWMDAIAIFEANRPDRLAEFAEHFGE